MMKDVSSSDVMAIVFSDVYGFAITCDGTKQKQKIGSQDEEHQLPNLRASKQSLYR
jgi:hypothetical protein